MVQESKPKIKKLTKEKIQEYVMESKDNKTMDLSNRGIENIISLEGLKGFTKLFLNSNKLTKLSDMKQVSHVTMLKVNDNKLSGEAIDELRHLQQLVTLNLGENHIARISPEVLRNMRNLKALVLNKNNIMTLDWLPKLAELNSLILSHNRISEFLPRTIDRLPNLTKISISHNRLKAIPDFSSLSSLTEIRLSYNEITTIPSCLAKVCEYCRRLKLCIIIYPINFRVANLKLLDLGHNQIDTWNGIEELGKLEQLKQLNLSGNPICGRARDDFSNKKEEKIENSKEIKSLDKKNKQYNFQMKRIFPHLIIRDGERVINKKSHGFIHIPKEKNKQTNDKQQEQLDKQQEQPEQHEQEDDKEKNDKKTKIEYKVKHNITMDSSNLHVNDAATVTVTATDDTDTADTATTTSATIAIETKKKLLNDTTKTKTKNKRRQPKEIGSGVLVVKHLKKQKTKTNQIVDFSQVDFTKNKFTGIDKSIGMGGASSWD